MAVDAVEFIRRFLLHVLPSGFVHVRHYGFLANRCREEKLPLCRRLIAAAKTKSTQAETAEEAEGAAEPGSPGEGAGSEESERHHRCPCCGQGRMLRVEVYAPKGVERDDSETQEERRLDTS